MDKKSFSKTQKSSRDGLENNDRPTKCSHLDERGAELIYFGHQVVGCVVPPDYESELRRKLNIEYKTEVCENKHP